jgi:hypothetical protein
MNGRAKTVEKKYKVEKKLKFFRIMPKNCVGSTGAKTISVVSGRNGKLCPGNTEVNLTQGRFL